jgi:hypothetical protein
MKSSSLRIKNATAPVETALVRVQNDIIHAIDNNRSAILVLLDLSAAFDTVHHAILLKRLETRYGISGTALDWFMQVLFVSS